MSAPASIKLSPPCPVDPRIRRKHMISYVIHNWLILIPGSFLLYFLFGAETNLYTLRNILLPFISIADVNFYLLTPIFLVFIYYMTLFWAAAITRIRIAWLNMKHKPREGIFQRTLDDQDYVYWNKRNLARVFYYWLLKTFPLPWAKTFLGYRIFGLKAGNNIQMSDCWVSPEFIEIGNNVQVGQGAAVFSYMFEPDRLLVAKVVLENNVIIGPRTTVFAGVKIHENTIVSSCSFILPFQDLEKDCIYFGNPVEKVRCKNPDEF